MRRLLAFAALSAVALTATACPSDDNKPAPDPGAGGRPRSGGVLRLGVTKLQSLDPAQARTVEQMQIADILFDTLTAYDPKTFEPQAAIADRWEATDDQKSWVFHIRPDAKFANGRAITAADVKYSVERIVRKGSDANALIRDDLLSDVVGYAAFAVEGTAGDLAGVTTPAPDLVRFDLGTPLSVLPAVLAHPGFGVVPREEVERGEGRPPFAQEPVGSGPYSYTRAADGVVSLSKAPGSAGHVDRIELAQFDDVAGAYAAFRSGDVDWARVPPDQVAEAGEEYGRRHYTPYLAELFFGFNLKSPTFANPKFRAAILAAVDRRAIVQAVYDTTVSRLDGIVVPTLRADRDDLCAGACDYDVTRAKQLVTEAFGTSAPPDVQIDFDEDPTYEAVAKALQANLRDAGIPATLRPRGLAEYREFVVSGNQQLFRFGWIAPYPSPDAFLFPLFFSGSRSNLVGLTSGPIDDQLRAARAAADRAARAAAWTAAERAILAEFPVLPLAQFQIHAVVADRVRGLETLATGTFDPTSVWIAR